MCNPLLVGAGLSVGGGVVRGLQGQANQAAQKAAELQAYKRSKKARTDEIARQMGFETQTMNGFNNTLGDLSAENYGASREASIQSFMDTLNSRPSEIPQSFTLPGMNNTTDAVSTEIARRTAAAASEARDRVSALADLSSYDAAAIDRSLSLGENADNLSTINGFRRGSLGVAQSEQTIPAATVYPGSSLLADLLSGGGSLITGANLPVNQWSPIDLINGPG